MYVTRDRPDTLPGPSEWFTGTALLDEIAVPARPSRLRVHSVHFTPGARTAWHRHPLGQVLHVTEGADFVRLRGGPIERIRAGDTVSASLVNGTGTARGRGRS